MPIEHQVNRKIPRRLLITIAVVFGLGLLLIAFIFGFSNFYNDKIIPGVKIGSLSLGGKTYEEALNLISEKSNLIADQGLNFAFGDKKINMASTIEDSANPELSLEIFSFDPEATVNKIKNALSQYNEAEKVYLWLVGLDTPMVYRLDEERLKSELNDSLKKYEKPAQNAQLLIKADDTIEVLSEKAGQVFPDEQILATVKKDLENLDNLKIDLQLVADNPNITQAAGEKLIGLAQQILDSAPFYLIYQDKKWELSREQIKKWLALEKSNSSATVNLSRTNLEKYLKDIAKEIDVETKEAKFTIENGKVAEFQPSQNGQALQIQESIDWINEKIKQIAIFEIDLIVKETPAQVTTENINDYGIKELIGEGRTNFKGSPKNRRHNISVGANTLNGILIKPDEEFSLVKALGKIEASTGYLPELVIKGNKTIPEFGGGLCQIGTTTFRVALNSGLPITARTNHSYRVSYYEPPAGMDATIYDPAPDFRFINDTGHYILFQTEILGNDLIFRFYGTKDGRQIELSKPRLFNYVKPGPGKLIETLDLKPGEKKCTEKAHTGADAEFTYKVTYANGEVKSQVFKSHYKPWQEVCLIGVEKLSE